MVWACVERQGDASEEFFGILSYIKIKNEAGFGPTGVWAYRGLGACMGRVWAYRGLGACMGRVWAYRGFWACIGRVWAYRSLGLQGFGGLHGPSLLGLGLGPYSAPLPCPQPPIPSPPCDVVWRGAHLPCPPRP